MPRGDSNTDALLYLMPVLPQLFRTASPFWPESVFSSFESEHRPNFARGGGHTLSGHLRMGPGKLLSPVYATGGDTQSMVFSRKSDTKERPEFRCPISNNHKTQPKRKEKNLMKQFSKLFATAIGVAGALATGTTARGDLILSSFPAGFTLNAYYANWSTATHSDTGTGFMVTSHGYGSGYSALPSTMDGSAYNAIQMTLDVAGPGPGIPISSAIADLTDSHGDQEQFAMQYGLQAGAGQTYMMLLSAGHMASGTSLDLTQLTDFNIEDDPGGYSGQYTVTYHDLRLVNVPEPASLALFGLAGAGLLIFRRRK
jgi:hypothetical protein